MQRQPVDSEIQGYDLSAASWAWEGMIRIIEQHGAWVAAMGERHACPDSTTGPETTGC